MIPEGTGTFGSKSLQIGGTAARVAADGVVEKGKQLAAEYLEASADDMVLDTALGRFHVAGTSDPSLSWEELATRAGEDDRLGELKVADEFGAPPTFPFGAHIAVVEVDIETGKVKLQRFIAVDDAGTLINPLLAEGQVHGGVATGVAQALYEDFVYDEDGTPLTQHLRRLWRSRPPQSSRPGRRSRWRRRPRTTRSGAKGIGESGTIGATPAVHNAVLDALAPYGVKHVDLPCNGENVWRAIQEAKS